MARTKEANLRAETERRPWLTVVLCAIVAALDGFDVQAIAYVAPNIGADWGIVPARFGPVFAAGLVGLALGAILIAPLADRWGRKRVIIGCVLLFGLTSLATASASSLEALLAFRLVTGLGLGGAMPNLIAATNEQAPVERKAMLVTLMFCGFPLGSTLGGIASIPMIERFGWASIFLLGGVLPLLVLPFLAAFLPESRPRPERAGDAPARVGAARLWAAGRRRTTFLLWLAFFMNLLVMYFLVNWLPSLLHGSGLSLRVAVASTAILNLGGVMGGIVIGQLIDRMPPYPVLVIAYAGAAVAIALVALAGSNIPLLLGAATLAGVGVVGAQISLNAVTAEAYPPEIRATGIGYALGIGRIGSILGPVLGGFLLGMGWSNRALLLAAVLPALVAAGSLAVLALDHRKGARHEP